MCKKEYKRGRYTVVVDGSMEEKHGSLIGKNIVFTGRGPYTRGRLMELARRSGGVISSNVITKQTDLLVVGDAPGSKLIKAKRMNIEIMDMLEFISRVKENDTYII